MKRAPSSWRSSTDADRRKSGRSSRSSSARCSSLASRASWMPAHHSSLPASAAAARRIPCADLVVVVDGVLGLVLAVVDLLQQRRVEVRLLGRGVHLEVRGELAPQHGGGLRLLTQVRELRELRAERLVVGEDQPDDVGLQVGHGGLPFVAGTPADSRNGAGRPARTRNCRCPDAQSNHVSALDGFSPATRDWFRGAFAAPTAAQEGAWAAAQAGRHALVVAPTGSGKTLAAFLWALDRLAADSPPPDPRHRCRVLYVSPLKALAVDVQRNLRAPLTGHPAGGATGRHAAAGDHGRDAHRRHPGRRAAAVRPHAAGRAGHHARSRCSCCSPRRPGSRCAACARSSWTRCTRWRAPSAARTSRCRWSGSTRCSAR